MFFIQDVFRIHDQHDCVVFTVFNQYLLVLIDVAIVLFEDAIVMDS